ncbi:MAG: hypothetical protein FWJ90_07755 [Actinomadura sp.]
MTERGHGAPDPAGPSSPGDTRAPTSPPQATAPTADLAAVRRTDAIIESLAARRGAGSAERPLSGAETGRPRQAEDSDPAVRLLRALIDDVDDPGSGDAGRGTGPGPTPPSGPEPGPRRRGPRTIVALGVAGAVLASGGVAAAGDDADRSSAAAPAPRSAVGGAEETAGSAHADTDAGTFAPPRARGGARPAPEPGRPAPAPRAPRAPEKAKERKTREPDGPRAGHPFPFGPRPSRPELPTITVRSDVSRFTAEPDAPPFDFRRNLEELRKRAERHTRDPDSRPG